MVTASGVVTLSENIDRDRIEAKLKRWRSASRSAQSGDREGAKDRAQTSVMTMDAEVGWSASASFPAICGSMTRILRLAIGVAALALSGPAFAATGIADIWHQTHWGESSAALRQQFGAEVKELPRALDFGDSYADLVLPHQLVGGIPMVVFFQMDKATQGLKRIQLERPRHGVNPPAFRAILASLRSDFGAPDQVCAIPVRPAGGYQAAAEELWLRNGAAVSAIFRDTTLQAFEGCLFGPATGTCGLTGQFLVRIGPPNGDGDPCSLASHQHR